jgi:hypothetical protein
MSSSDTVADSAATSSGDAQSTATTSGVVNEVGRALLNGATFELLGVLRLSRGEAWTATATIAGVSISIENSGQGAGNRYTSPGGWEEVSELERVVLAGLTTWTRDPLDVFLGVLRGGPAS